MKAKLETHISTLIKIQVNIGRFQMRSHGLWFEKGTCMHLHIFQSSLYQTFYLFLVQIVGMDFQSITKSMYLYFSIHTYIFNIIIDHTYVHTLHSYTILYYTILYIHCPFSLSLSLCVSSQLSFSLSFCTCVAFLRRRRRRHREYLPLPVVR